MNTESKPFWKTKTLQEMARFEWESLCDGCARCCLNKLEYMNTGEIEWTSVACRLLDQSTCRCTDYAHRARLVSDCMILKADQQEAFAWLPSSCAYRRLSRGEELPEWHPLLTGRAESVHEAGISVRDFAVSENEAREWSIMADLGANEK